MCVDVRSVPVMLPAVTSSQPIKPLETPPHQAAYDRWRDDSTTENLHETVKHLEPTIQGVLRSMHGADDPAMHMQAKLLAARAVRTYDPAYGAALPTWVSQQMQPLRRFRRMNLAHPVRVPEQIQLDAFHLMQSENDLRDSLGRDPDVTELADHSKLPPRRIETIRKSFRRMPAQGAMGEAASLPTAAQTDMSDEALHYVYHDADLVDRKIIEMKTGYGGAFDPMAPGDIARRMNLSPVQLSRRSAKLALKLEELRTALQTVNT